MTDKELKELNELKKENNKLKTEISELKEHKLHK